MGFLNDDLPSFEKDVKQSSQMMSQLWKGESRLLHPPNASETSLSDVTAGL